MSEQRVRHMVIFCLRHDSGSPESETFLHDGRAILTAIPQVECFEVLRQVSPKNDYDFGFSMEFANQSAYEAYNEHPAHGRFVRERWETEVTRFLEIDLEVMN
ncbi:Dabb family protein [Paenibacillus sp. UNC451MF]|uniref:Dabb family protein n=1 Tax=Paenibacillus sp. UNC451MF TaxID=1449063 RepID=UPI00048B3D4C|nr:Dabb family protein [Paenibacillus sp. UNC451MF]